MVIRSVGTVLLALVTIAASGACDSGTDSDVVLLASPDSIVLTRDEPAAQIRLTTAPRGSVEFELSAAPDWVTVSPDAGSIDGEMVAVTVVGSLDTFQAGTQAGDIEFVSDAGVATVRVVAVIPIVREVDVPEEVVIPDTTDSIVVPIRNSGTVNFSWDATSSEPWLELTPASENTTPGQTTNVELKVDRTGLPAGEATATVIFHTWGTTEPIAEMLVRVETAPTPVAHLPVTRLRLAGDASVDTLFIVNTGRGPLEFTVEVDSAWASVAPTTGTVAIGDTGAIVVTVDRASLPASIVESTIRFTTNGATPEVTATVVVDNRGLATPRFRALDHVVVDAEYHRGTGRLVTISAFPHVLRVIDPLLGTTQTVTLGFEPTALSISVDGERAAVGHAGIFSYVDLGRAEVLRTYSAPSTVHDLVIAPNGWVHLFPREYGYASSVELTFGQRFEALQAYAPAQARLHPGGRYIYAADVGVQPPDVRKYDLSDGALDFVYDSPYHGEHSFYHDLWIAETGERIFTQGGTVLTVSTIANEDLRFAGSLSGLTEVRWVADAPELDRVLALALRSGNPSSSILVYDRASLALIDSVALPAFGSTTAASDGVFVFADPAGSVYVLARRWSESWPEPTNVWGLFIIPASEVP
ncbi:MAG TPA: hypothetical protein VF039_14575 [Longimicrobiales bacterium]